jgi:hypothetical protein
VAGDPELLGFLLKTVGKIENSPPIRYARRRVSDVIGNTVSQKNMVFFVLQYNEEREELEHNIAKYDDLVRHSTWLHIDSPTEEELIS